MKSIIKLYKKNKEIILYVIFGVLTTIANILIFISLSSGLKINYLISNIIAWSVSVVFAFITNKYIVFKSSARGYKYFKQIISFFTARLISLFIDMAIMFILISIVHTKELWAKIVSNVVIIIINYLLSKLLIFKKG